MNDKHRRQPPNLGYMTGICRTGKRSYFTMAGAKKAAKALRGRGEKAVHAYRCDHCQHCHIGHLPFAVRRGAQTAREWRAAR